MIKFRQKEYSSIFAKTVAGVEKALGKAPMQAKRAAIKAEQNIMKGSKAANEAVVRAGKKSTLIPAKTARAVRRLDINPGGEVNRTIRTVVKNPVGVGSNIAGKILMVTNPATAAIPVGVIGVGAEQAIKKVAPGYKKATEGAAKKYKVSKAARYVEGGVNAISSSLKGFG